jgi:hypothetical protein
VRSALAAETEAFYDFEKDNFKLREIMSRNIVHKNLMIEREYKKIQQLKLQQQ